MFKSYLEVKLEEKGKQIDGKSETDKQVGRLRFIGNQKQFEHNAKLYSVPDRIRAETDGRVVTSYMGSGIKGWKKGGIRDLGS